MDDFVKSGFGSETTDQCLRTTTIKPVWYLTPLPLSFLPPRPRPKASLYDLCLSKVSRNLNEYTLEDLRALPPAIVSRILQQVKVDRKHNVSGDGLHLNPDETTLWAYNVLLDPQYPDLETDHTLAIPQYPTLHYLKPDETLAEPQHPFVAIPQLFYRFHPQPSLSLLTTITLDGMDRTVSDETIMTLRYCTHLTLLWTKGCGISDVAVRLLASSLDLEEKRGLCRLRGWFMPGCKGIGDRSMRSLSKWPGLAVIDVRETSVTSVGMGILNKFSRTGFGGHNADFQQCTPGLKAIFAADTRPSEILEMLCTSLTARPSTLEEDGSSRWWISLNLVPAVMRLKPEWLPHPPSAPKSHPDVWLPKKDRAAYIAGTGMVYGSKVHEIKDDIMTYRSNLKTAMRIQDEDEGLSTPVDPFPRYDFWSWKNEKKETERQKEKRLKGFHRIKGPDGKIVKKNPKPAGRKAKDADVNSIVNAEFMLVRMSAPNWEDLRWTLQNTVVAHKPVAMNAVKRAHAAGLITDILGTAGGLEYQHSQSTVPPLTAPSSSPPQSSSPGPSSSPASLTQHNPFNPFAVRASQTSSAQRQPLSQSSQTLGGLTQTDLYKSKTAPGFEPSQEHTAPFGKRRFEGTTGEEGKRKGMQMFSLKAYTAKLMR